MKKLWIVLLATALPLLGSCDKDEKIIEKEVIVEKEVKQRLSQIDLTIAIPIHKSSLSKFGYLITSTVGDSTTIDTITVDGGTVSIEPASATTRGDAVIAGEEEEQYEFQITGGVRTTQGDVVYYIKQMTGQQPPLNCTSEVELTPLPEATADSFKYIVPKPYIYATMYYEDAVPSTAGVTVSKAENIITAQCDDLALFLANYGRRHKSTFTIKEERGALSFSFI